MTIEKYIMSSVHTWADEGYSCKIRHPSVFRGWRGIPLQDTSPFSIQGQTRDTAAIYVTLQYSGPDVGYRCKIRHPSVFRARRGIPLQDTSPFSIQGQTRDTAARYVTLQYSGSDERYSCKIRHPWVFRARREIPLQDTPPFSIQGQMLHTILTSDQFLILLRSDLTRRVHQHKAYLIRRFDIQ